MSPAFFTDEDDRGKTTRVYLVNAAASGFTALTLQKHGVFGYDAAPDSLGVLQFDTFLDNNDFDSSFMLENVIPPNGTEAAAIGAEFLLRPRVVYERNINACLKNDDPLKLVDCGQEPSAYPDGIIWTVAGESFINRFDWNPLSIHSRLTCHCK